MRAISYQSSPEPKNNANSINGLLISLILPCMQLLKPSNLIFLNDIMVGKRSWV